MRRRGRLKKWKKAVAISSDKGKVLNGGGGGVEGGRKDEQPGSCFPFTSCLWQSGREVKEGDYSLAARLGTIKIKKEPKARHRV